MTCLQTIRVFNGHANTEGLVFGAVAADGSAELFNFGAATRLVLTVHAGDTAHVIDTLTSPNAIQVTGDGELTFDLGDAGLPPGKHLADLVVYAAAYPDGYVMDAVGGHTMQVDVRA
ncbi:MAG: hypothetical protein CME38_01270 [Haliea sp.]|nr:hypothetical protein [Haliea sp.]|tara:strand:+ start:3987 stop:4337 length:351 start_codon:yes stop_codon:yes gene_type:complete